MWIKMLNNNKKIFKQMKKIWKGKAYLKLMRELEEEMILKKSQNNFPILQIISIEFSTQLNNSSINNLMEIIALPSKTKKMNKLSNINTITFLKITTKTKK